jgi:outer membrane protein TolC
VVFVRAPSLIQRLLSVVPWSRFRRVRGDSDKEFPMFTCSPRMACPRHARGVAAIVGRRGAIALLATAWSLLGGCAFTPAGRDAERARLDQAGQPYTLTFEARELPDLPAEPSWRDVLHRAFMANGELESAYFEWAAAVERVDIASAWPNSRVMLGYGVELGPSEMKTFDRMSFDLAFDSMQNLAFPVKTKREGMIALAEARAAGERFRGAKFGLQREVLALWAEYAMLAEQARIGREQVQLSGLVAQTARSRIRAGGEQDDLLRADVAVRTDDDALRSLEARLGVVRAELNGLLARDPDAPLAPPARTPDPRPVPADDATLLARAAQQNPELGALAHAAQARADALERARLEWVPDINPSVSIMGTATQAIGAAVMLPTTVTQIEGGIREAGAMLRGSQAMLRQAQREKAAMVVATLVLLRDAERQAALFEESILPAAGRIANVMQQRYAAGATSYLDLIDAQEMLLEARMVLAEARAAREQRLAELEELIGADIEAIAASADQAPHTNNQPRPARAERGESEVRHDH